MARAALLEGCNVILLESVLHSAIRPAMALLPAKMDKPEAWAQLLAIGLQESRLKYRYQKVAGNPYAKGPARGLLQFERGGGVVGVMTHRHSSDLAKEVCKARGVPFDSSLIHARLEFDDVLAMAFGRLLLWTDPKPLPGLDASHDDSWACYIRNWRPGKPHRSTWDEFREQAVAQVSPD